LKKLLIFPVLIYILQASAQSDWKQSLHYDLHIKFNPAEKSLDAIMKLQYTNHSPDTLRYIWFQIWPNSYRNDRTSYSEQILENGDTRFYFSSKDQKGYLNRLDFRVNGSLAKMEDHPEYIDVVKLILPNALLPGDSISVSSAFHLRIPFNFNGNGYNAHHFEMRNWYPEPAVYDAHGWHPMPFLLQGGAYHEAADYVVEMEVPPAYRIAAGAAADTVSVSRENNLYRFSLQNANAFAWTADTRFKLNTDTLQTVSGRPICIQYFSTSANSSNPIEIISAAKKEIQWLSQQLGPYPHPTISIVEASPLADQNFSGQVYIGLNPLKDDWRPTLRQALLGQWFQTILLTDQRNQPWFSQGFISYYNQRLIRELSPLYPVPSPISNHNLWLRVAENEKTTQPITTPSPEFSLQNDSLIAKTKAALWLAILRDTAGKKRFDENMADYFAKWKFKHPYPEDFKMAMDTGSPDNYQTVFSKLNGNENLFTGSVKRILKPVFVFSARNSERYNYIGLAPIPGYNQYDGFMIGALIHNINLPENKFEFLFTPLFAFGSASVEGLGRLSYSWRPDNHFSKVTIGINGGRFDSNKATDSTGKNLFENFTKIVPYIRVDFKPSGPRSSVRKWMDFKTYLITEKNYDIPSYAISPKDSLNHPNSILSNFYYVNQLSFNLEDNRTLYPYDLRVEFQQSELFYRINLHANYFLNYSDGGGMQVSFFAAKFGVWNENNIDRVARYEPKLLGVNGEEDYLYEDYFIGRSATYAIDKPSIPNSGLAAQQIMNRDGGLKLRIDEFDYLQGKSANWVTSLNFNTTLPAKLFPFPLPIRIFFGFGTYAEAWQDNPVTSRFLYVGGIQLSLLKNLLNIYAPLIYSNDFNSALGSNNFGRKITFSIDIQHINYKKIIRKAAGT
jgi:hypothetical protein